MEKEKYSLENFGFFLENSCKETPTHILKLYKNKHNPEKHWSVFLDLISKDNKFSVVLDKYVFKNYELLEKNIKEEIINILSQRKDIESYDNLLKKTLSIQKWQVTNPDRKRIFNKIILEMENKKELFNNNQNYFINLKDKNLLEEIKNLSLKSPCSIKDIKLFFAKKGTIVSKQKIIENIIDEESFIFKHGKIYIKKNIKDKIIKKIKDKEKYKEDYLSKNQKKWNNFYEIAQANFTLNKKYCRWNEAHLIYKWLNMNSKRLKKGTMSENKVQLLKEIGIDKDFKCIKRTEMFIIYFLEHQIEHFIKFRNFEKDVESTFKKCKTRDSELMNEILSQAKMDHNIDFQEEIDFYIHKKSKSLNHLKL